MKPKLPIHLLDSRYIYIVKVIHNYHSSLTLITYLTIYNMLRDVARLTQKTKLDSDNY